MLSVRPLYLTMNLIRIDAREIADWDSFHEVFDRAFGFPDFYGRNLDAWIDCMTSLDSPEAGMTRVHAPEGGVVTIQLDNVAELADKCPDIYAAIVECSAFVNWRRIEQGLRPIVALSFHRA
jgi:RNAse (barnase) inhibitor barstar